MMEDGEQPTPGGRDTPLATEAQAVLRRVGLEGRAMRTRDRIRARQATRKDQRTLGPDGLPVPAHELISQVAGDISTDLFFSGGAQGREVITQTLARNDIKLDGLAMLDFGMGCGRVARHWREDDIEVHGCDYNPPLVEWVRNSLPFVHVEVNHLEPPLPYPDARFDVIYALSVFTHLTERQQRAWMTELRRVTRPGGYVLFSTHGPTFPHGDPKFRTPEVLARLEAGELLVFAPDHAGRNYCAALHPRSWVEENMLDGFELVEYVERGATMNGGQDIYLVRRAT
jgi:SAM-dependent methyltransferase